MDVRQLLLLAGDNSALAKKKVDRLTAQDDDDGPKISGDAVAAYLAKQKAFKDKIKAQEEEARKKRIQARLDASLGKPTRKEKKSAEKEKAISGHFLPGDKRSIDVVKEKKKEDKKQKREKDAKSEINSDRFRNQNNHRKRSESPECPVPKKKVKTDKEKSKSESSKVKTKEKTVEVDNENTHRKYKRRTADTFESSIHEEKLKEKEKNALISKEKSNKKGNKASNSNPNSSLSFTDLLKLAKTNAASARIADDGTLIKKKEKTRTFDDEHSSHGKSKSKDDSYESIRNMQKKMKSKDQSNESSCDNHKRSKHRDNYDESSSKSKHAHSSNHHHDHHHHKSKSKHDHEEVHSKSKHVNGIDRHKKSRYNDDYDEPSHKSHKDKKKIHNGSSESHVQSKKSIKDGGNKMGKDKLLNGHHSSKHNGERERDVYSNKHKHDNGHSKHSKKDSAKENRYVEDSPSPKRGLIAQTISTKKNGSVEHPDKISKVFKQVKPGRSAGIEAQCRTGKPSGIEAQFMKKGMKKKKMKRPVARRDDAEDDFEKEARMLARKRKLFEMQRITGNSNLVEEDIISDYEDYDLSEDEEEEDDDFIDDSEPVADVSKFIRKITGYDRRLYDDSDDDDRNMESSYSQIEKEEARSSRIAREEDRIAALEEAAELAREKAKEAAKKKKLPKR